tara:strand:- start:1227 stop:2744 length:1518 start_codon:yes stop_codon:yes gene_type:complete
MKRNVLFYVCAIALTFCTVSCGDDFLEPQRDTSELTDADFADNIDVNPALVEGTLNGIYTFMIQRFGALGDDAGRHYDIGHKGIDVWTDMLCGDMALSTNTYSWYAGTSNLVFTTNFSDDENEIMWNYLYRVLNTANLLIAQSGGEDAVPEGDEAKAILGQSKALRAYGYFYLTQLFQREYDPNQEILPFYTSDPTQTSFAKVPASQIYDLIVSDLTSAVVLLEDYNRPLKHYINKSVAQGLLAYTYAAMGNYPDAKTVSEQIVNTGGYSLLTAGELAYPGSGSGFSDVNSAAWMWGYDLTTDIGLGLVSWWGIVDLYSYSYAAAGDRKAMDDALFAQIPDSDIRKSQFLDDVTDTNHLMPINKFYAPNRVVFSQNPMTTDYIYMRVEEFYLLSAEASAKTGDETTAKTRLKELLNIRMGTTAAAAAVDPLTGQALIDFIYLQTRIEMWGEGKSYFAMKRNQATITRGTNHAFQAGATLIYNADNISPDIPQSELNNNPAIISQN